MEQVFVYITINPWAVHVIICNKTNRKSSSEK